MNKDDEDTEEFTIRPKVILPKTSKISFKKSIKSTNGNNSSKSRRSNLTFRQDDDEIGQDDDDLEINLNINNTKKTSKPLLSSNLSFQNLKRDTINNQRRINLSKYKSLSATPELQKESILPSPESSNNKVTNIDDIQIDENFQEFEFDEEDPDNNPIIANIQDIDPSIRQKYLQQQQLKSTPQLTQIKNYVPIETNKEPQENLSKRQLLKQLATEYKDSNYDDGSGEFEKHQQQEQLNVSTIKEESLGMHDFELSDSDMGTLKPTIDFTKKYNMEISESEQEEDEDNEYLKEVKILSIDEQIDRITLLIKDAKIENDLKIIKTKEITKELERVKDAKEMVLQRLNNLV
ncbi:hypothetical protein KGF54_000555 [Candida jiufengensis]|uniref:uncharacterized protein n=1 Tax=Candida jiufengensis TaxID=497108 RepID=UPI0022257D04|nr:uncharacterized protein KGF54_000555 [Candida jiufengensis]KAI5956936.1 hypothetical protein KGF54_000555 [Candida jiufengensis]